MGSISDIETDRNGVGQGGRGIFGQVKFKIPDDTKARIFSDGLMGGKAVELELGKSAKYLQQGDTLFSRRSTRISWVAGSEFEFLKQRANDVITN